MTKLDILNMFGPNTHSIEIRDSEERQWLINQGYITWVPPIFGSNNQYSITSKGLAYREGAKKYGEPNWKSPKS